MALLVLLATCWTAGSWNKTTIYHGNYKNNDIYRINEGLHTANGLSMVGSLNGLSSNLDIAVNLFTPP